MRNRQQWRPTKFRIGKSGQLLVPGAAGELAPGSILITTLVARWYAKTLPRYACGTLLDLGCGKMPFYEIYADHVEQVLSMDWPRSLYDPVFLDFAADLNVHRLLFIRPQPQWDRPDGLQIIGDLIPLNAVTASRPTAERPIFVSQADCYPVKFQLADITVRLAAKQVFYSSIKVIFSIMLFLKL